MLESNSIVKSITSFLRCVYTTARKMQTIFSLGHHLGKHRTLCLQLHHRHSSSVRSTGSYVWHTCWVCLAFTTKGILCNFLGASFLFSIHFSRVYSHCNCVVGFMIFVFTASGPNPPWHCSSTGLVQTELLWVFPVSSPFLLHKLCVPHLTYQLPLPAAQARLGKLTSLWPGRNIRWPGPAHRWPFSESPLY